MVLLDDDDDDISRAESSDRSLFSMTDVLQEGSFGVSILLTGKCNVDIAFLLTKIFCESSDRIDLL